MILSLPDQHIDFSVPVPALTSLNHNLPVGDYDFFVVQFVRSVQSPAAVIVVAGDFIFSAAAIDISAQYKLIALPVRNGIADGVWWYDGYVYDENQVNIEFTSSGDAGGGSGETKTFTGACRVAGQPVSRTVIAYSLDDAPQIIATAVSDPVTGQYTLEWTDYTGEIMITAMDDYGVEFNSGDARGVGERIHPASPNGYVYEVSSSGTLGDEPAWPTAEGETVISGSVVMTSKPFYQPQSQGPITIT